jgi:hypothetical protein
MSKAKKMTRKEQKIAEEKAALRRRIEDVLIGASGGFTEDEDCGVMGVLGLESLSQWIIATARAVKWVPTDEFEREKPAEAEKRSREFAFGVRSLKHFDTLNEAVDHLYANGFRACANTSPDLPRTF